MNPMHLCLHGLAVKKHASPDTVAALLGLANSDVEAALRHATETGRVADAGGKFMLTPAGRMILESQYSRFYAAARSDHVFCQAHERFEVVNHDLKQTITDWQTMPLGGKQLANDHSDVDYDEKIIDRLGQIHERVEPILQTLAQRIARFGHYLEKLEAALEKAEDGDKQWVSDANLDSYHTVWFELHEDILRVLGRAREE